MISSSSTRFDELFSLLGPIPSRDTDTSEEEIRKLKEYKNPFFSDIYFNRHGKVVQIKEIDVEKDLNNFYNIQKLFLGSIFAQYTCQHPCVVPLGGWSLFEYRDDNADDADDDVVDAEKEIEKRKRGKYPPAFAQVTPYYKDGTLYDYMKTWGKNGENFNPTNASIILYGITRGLDCINYYNYPISYLSPKNIYLSKLLVGDQKKEVYRPLIGDIGNLGERPENSNTADDLRPIELKDTTNPDILKFFIGLYFLFKERSDSHHLILEFFGSKPPENSDSSDVFHFTMDEQRIGRPHDFIHVNDVHIFANYDQHTYGEYVSHVNALSTSHSFSLNDEGIEIRSLIESDTPNLDMKLVSKLIKDSQNSKGGTKSDSGPDIRTFQLLAIMYSSGQIYETDFCTSAYFAKRAASMSPEFNFTHILMKFPNCQYPTEAEKLYHEAEVLEGNGYATPNREERDAILLMAANKYNLSSQKGYLKAKTKLANMVINACSGISAEEKRKAIERLLVPASMKDQNAMYELGMQYLHDGAYDKAIQMLGKAYESNHIDAAFQVAKAMQTYAIKLNEEVALEKDKNEATKKLNLVEQYLIQARSVYNFVYEMYGDEIALQNKENLDAFFKENKINVKA